MSAKGWKQLLLYSNWISEQKWPRLGRTSLNCGRPSQFQPHLGKLKVVSQRALSGSGQFKLKLRQLLSQISAQSGCIWASLQVGRPNRPNLELPFHSPLLKVKLKLWRHLQIKPARAMLHLWSQVTSRCPSEPFSLTQAQLGLPRRPKNSTDVIARASLSTSTSTSARQVCRLKVSRLARTVDCRLPTAKRVEVVGGTNGPLMSYGRSWFLSGGSRKFAIFCLETNETNLSQNNNTWSFLSLH